ncbi:glycosyltransferase family protein [Desulfovibrio sp. TomC]|uniref:glycosyltransferase family protein n=1 Tax=Desulfovibrio sp. TomC TaxID=1562888 RepID=UPI00057379E6|nr:glycosyltransferase [Desulfovibrio sp. TomC]KHK03520.1 hypothetical protein NY78_1108 [Desulfovibrio sp. TomC]
MRIVHFGQFLQEGFKEIGCEVVPLQLDATKTLTECIEDTGVQPDLVVIEFFGQTSLPKEFFNCNYKLAAYCIDSPLNEYWLIPLTKLFDFVYVDQLSSVSKFRRNGVPAKWLPLSVLHMDFRPTTEKKHFITFVGRMTPHRVKRNNLIQYIHESFPIHVVEGISRSALQDVFAASQIVLNENFFPGLSMRCIQALASGSLLLTERSGYGVRPHFLEGKHYIGYSPNDVISTIKAIERSYDSFASVASCGQEECRRGHTSANRAKTILEDVASGKRHVVPSVDERKLHEAQGKYASALRFGGKYDESVKLLVAAANVSDAMLSQAWCVLGSIHLRAGRNEPGIAALEKSASAATVHGVIATLKLMLFFADDSRFFNYLSALILKIQALRMKPKNLMKYIQRLLAHQDTYYNSCLLACELLFAMNMNYDIGFHKSQKEEYPDYAMEYAVLAFAAQKTVESLDAIIKCTKKCNFAPEALGYIKEAILVGAASDEQIALSVSLAREYYDFLYAETTLKALQATIA